MPFCSGNIVYTLAVSAATAKNLHYTKNSLKYIKIGENQQKMFKLLYKAIKINKIICIISNKIQKKKTKNKNILMQNNFCGFGNASRTREVGCK